MSELFRIVNGALRLDIDKVRNYTAFLAEKLEKAGDVSSAGRLRKMLEESDHQLRPAGAAFAKVLPVDEDSRFPLIEQVNLKTVSEPPVVLGQEQWDTVNEFLSIAKSYAQADVDGLTTSLSLLMYGPPGTGKSRLARHIAKELGLDLYVARLDGLISSFLGSTSKNIRALFDFAAKTPCVLFLDEFDAIAKLRGDSQELGELKRVVNSFIQNLDTLGSHSIVIAATNHQESAGLRGLAALQLSAGAGFSHGGVTRRRCGRHSARDWNSRSGKSRYSSICRKGFPARTFVRSTCGSAAVRSRSSSTPG